MADLQTLKGVPGQKNWYSLWTQNIDYLQSITTEVETARQGQANLSASINLRMTQAQVQSLILGGGLPSDIAITSLNIGTGIDGDVLKIEGTSVIATNNLVERLFYGSF